VDRTAGGGGGGGLGTGGTTGDNVTGYLPPLPEICPIVVIVVA